MRAKNCAHYAGCKNPATHMKEKYKNTEQNTSRMERHRRALGKVTSFASMRDENILALRLAGLSYKSIAEKIKTKNGTELDPGYISRRIKKYTAV